MKTKTRNLIGSTMVWTGILSIIILNFLVILFPNSAFYHSITRYAVGNIVLAIIVIIGGAWGMRRSK